jgi:probable O-glycosylation ligase (exosortase A-associated)
MLRTLLVLTFASIGTAYAVFGPFNALLYYLWVAYFRPHEWVWGGIVQELRLSFVAGLLVVATSLFSRARFRLDVRTSLLGLILLQSLLSTVLSPYIAYSWPYFVDFAKSTIITYFIVILVTDLERFRKVLVVIALSLGLEATKQGWAQLVLNPGEKNFNAYGMLGDNNAVAIGMLMLAGILVALMRTANGQLERRVYQFMLLGVMYRGLTTYSRGGMLAAVGAALWFVSRSQQKTRAVVAVGLAGILILPVLPSEFWDRMSTIQEARQDLELADGSIRGRINFWSAAIGMANSQPVTGVGHNAFTRAYNLYDPSAGEFGPNRAVHSTWLGLLSELGYPGLILFVLLLGLAFTACHRARSAVRLGAPGSLNHYALALEVGLIAFSVGGTFVSVQYGEFVWHFFGLSAALFSIAQPYHSSRRRTSPRSRAVPLRPALQAH